MKSLEELLESGAFDEHDRLPQFEKFRPKRNEPFYPPSARETLDRTSYGDLVAVARGRIIDAFIHRTDEFRGKRRVSDQLLGVGNRKGALAAYVARFCSQHPFISTEQLTDSQRKLTSGKQRLIIDAWQLECIEKAIQPLRLHKQIWFNEWSGAWEMLQSVKDERSFQTELLYCPFKMSPA